MTNDQHDNLSQSDKAEFAKRLIREMTEPREESGTDSGGEFPISKEVLSKMISDVEEKARSAERCKIIKKGAMTNTNPFSDLMLGNADAVEVLIEAPDSKKIIEGTISIMSPWIDQNVPVLNAGDVFNVEFPQVLAAADNAEEHQDLMHLAADAAEDANADLDFGEEEPDATNSGWCELLLQSSELPVEWMIRDVNFSGEPNGIPLAVMTTIKTPDGIHLAFQQDDIPLMASQTAYVDVTLIPMVGGGDE